MPAAPRKVEPTTAVPILHLAAQLTIQPDFNDLLTDQWTIFNRSVSVASEGDLTVATFDGKPGDGVAWLEGFDFQNGSIQLLIRGKNNPGRSFVGVAFRGMDHETYDAVYFRPFNFVADNHLSRTHMVQYISHPVYTWSKLREEHPDEYENPPPHPPNPEEFFKATIVIEKPLVSVYVNDEPEPCLVVNELSGRVGLWMGNNSEGAFARMVIRPSGGS